MAQSHPHPQLANTPGLIHISPALLQGNQALQFGKRSKSASQRASNQVSARNKSAGQSSQETEQSVIQDIEAVQPGNGNPATTSSGIESKKDRKMRHLASTSNTIPLNSKGHSDWSMNMPVRYEQGMPILEAEQYSTVSTRLQHKRGRSQNPQKGSEVGSGNAGFSQDTLDIALLPPPSPSLLSKSAPATSVLNKIKHGVSTHKQKVGTSNDIRSSNSADEWDMPMTARGNDALTWQQKDLGRPKPSTGNLKFAKKLFQMEDSGLQTPQKMSGISVMAAADSAAADRSILSASPNPLTWQQALLQVVKPGSPSPGLFEALEDGHSGAHPAKEARLRPSPTKQRRQRSAPNIHTNNQSAIVSEEEGGLENELSSLALDNKAQSAKQGRRPNKRLVPASTVSTPISIPTAANHYVTRSSTHQQRQANHTSESEGDASLDEAANVQLGEVTRGMSSLAPSKPRSVPASPVKTPLYAGPKFHNSPDARDLPTPRLAAFLNRNRDSTAPVGDALAA
ncbi:MAG: hypothetical protein CYPHOPRED_004427 [Cyphobasidiales sp. Tagirdzhanova-0007]|nr:MAG: hypothetical protein CYPHOPRED_004427 [Cyphobasidiales sp. Tagirdzhanova-0007]